jgi:regulator of replication initiation timing
MGANEKAAATYHGPTHTTRRTDQLLDELGRVYGLLEQRNRENQSLFQSNYNLTIENNQLKARLQRLNGSTAA